MVTAFNTGFDIGGIVSNWTECTDNTLLFASKQIPTYALKAFKYGDYKDIFFNSTLILKNATYSLQNCTMASE